MAYPEFRMYRAEEGTVPVGVTYAGTVTTPEGETFGVHARVVEVEGGRKEFVGGLFRIDVEAA